MKKRSSARFLSYLDKIECDDKVNNELLNRFFEENGHHSTKLLREALETTLGETSRTIANVTSILFGTAHKPINKFLEIMGFGKLTHMP